MIKQLFTLSLLLICLTAIAQTPVVVRGPYLQTGTPTSVIVRWRTDIPTESKLKYSTVQGGAGPLAVAAGTRTEHIVEIKNLQPNTVYYYDLQHSNGSFAGQADQHFRTSPVPGTRKPVRFWALGDCGTANGNQRDVRDAYYNYLNNLPAGEDQTDLIMLLGDNAYGDGEDDEYQDAIFEDMYEEKLKQSVVWSTLGNHDGHSATASSQSGPYFDIFSFPKNAEAGGIASGTEAYYSFDYANIHFIVLESHQTNRNVGGAMYNWAQADIQSTTADWIVAVWHHPPYTRGSHYSDIELQLFEMRQNFLPMLERNGVDLVLCGHSHSYERSYFLNGHYGLSFSFDANQHTVGATGDGDGDPNGDGSYVKQTTGPDAGKGAVYLTAGSSGKTSGGLLNHPAMVTSLNELGSCVVEVNLDTMTLKFLRETGAVDDQFTIIKQGIVPPDITLTYVPNNQVLLCGSDTSVAATGSVTATTTCAQGGLTITYTDSIVPGLCAPSYTIVRTWTATDACSNSNVYRHSISLIDPLDPEAICAVVADTIFMNGVSDLLPDVTGNASGTDNCSPNVTITQFPAAGTAIDTGNYSIALIATDECGRTDTCFMALAVLDTAQTVNGIKTNNTDLLGVKVYPNPATHQLNIDLPKNITGKVTVDVISNDNRVVLQQSLSYRSNSVDISELPVGVYLVKLNYNGQTRTHQVVISR